MMPFWNYLFAIYQTVARFGTWTQTDKNASCVLHVSKGRTRIWLQHLNARLVGSYFAAISAEYGRHLTLTITGWHWRDLQPSHQTPKIRRINLQYVFPCCCCISFLVSPTAFGWLLPSACHCLPSGGALSDFVSWPFVILTGLGHFVWKLCTCTELLHMI